MHLQALPICTGVDNSSPRDDLVPHTIPHTMSSESPHPKTKQTIFFRDSGCMLIPEFNNTTRCSICAHTQSKFMKSASKRKRHLDEFGDIPFSDAAHNTGVLPSRANATISCLKLRNKELQQSLEQMSKKLSESISKNAELVSEELSQDIHTIMENHLEKCNVNDFTKLMWMEQVHYFSVYHKLYNKKISWFIP